MIAKIYGKSTKFVQNNKPNEHFKKPKVHHMKEILRKQASQQKNRADLNDSKHLLQVEA